MIGKIDFFVENEIENLAMIAEYAIAPSFDQIFCATKTNKNILISTKDIIQKFIHMTINNKEYVVKRPNKFETN